MLQRCSDVARPAGKSEFFWCKRCGDRTHFREYFENGLCAACFENARFDAMITSYQEAIYAGLHEGDEGKGDTRK